MFSLLPYIGNDDYDMLTMIHCIFSEYNYPDSQEQTEVEKYYCQICFKSYKSSAALRFHQQVDCGKMPKFGCLYCSYVSRRKSDIHRHMKRYCKQSR